VGGLGRSSDRSEGYGGSTGSRLTGGDRDRDGYGGNTGSRIEEGRTGGGLTGSSRDQYGDSSRTGGLGGSGRDEYSSGLGSTGRDDYSSGSTGLSGSGSGLGSHGTHGGSHHHEGHHEGHHGGHHETRDRDTQVSTVPPYLRLRGSFTQTFRQGRKNQFADQFFRCSTPPAAMGHLSRPEVLAVTRPQVIRAVDLQVFVTNSVVDPLVPDTTVIAHRLVCTTNCQADAQQAQEATAAQDLVYVMS